MLFLVILLITAWEVYWTYNACWLASKLNDTHPEIRKQCVLAIMKLNSTNHIANIKELLLKEKDKEVISVLKLCINRLE